MTPRVPVRDVIVPGSIRISWMDDRVTAAMRALHGEPSGDAGLFA